MRKKMILMISLGVVLASLGISLQIENQQVEGDISFNIEYLNQALAQSESGGGSGGTCYNGWSDCYYFGCYWVPICRGSECRVMRVDEWRQQSTC